MSLYDMASFIVSESSHPTYDKRKVNRTELDNSLVISTVWASDIDEYETAVIDCVSTYPIERYDDKYDAEKGHEKWVKKLSDTPKTVVELGYPGVCDSEETELLYGERYEQWKQEEERRKELEALEWTKLNRDIYLQEVAKKYNSKIDVGEYSPYTICDEFHQNTEVIEYHSSYGGGWPVCRPGPVSSRVTQRVHLTDPEEMKKMATSFLTDKKIEGWRVIEYNETIDAAGNIVDITMEKYVGAVEFQGALNYHFNNKQK